MATSRGSLLSLDQWLLFESLEFFKREINVSAGVLSDREAGTQGIPGDALSRPADKLLNVGIRVRHKDSVKHDSEKAFQGQEPSMSLWEKPG